ncbi:hypothetical protein LMZ02_11805 [Paenibacillus macerans]|nr:hypothetical protein [Paenibacillus macerans]UMV49987.1 hypothetical protein LMZ02_11805 [Paenibacillus macerans]
MQFAGPPWTALIAVHGPVMALTVSVKTLIAGEFLFRLEVDKVDRE